MINLAAMKDMIETAIDDVLPRDELTEHDHLYEGLGMDSMAAVVLVVEIQKRYGVRIPDGEVPQLMTVGEVMRCVQRLTAVTVEQQ